jgi:hypothetical protein
VLPKATKRGEGRTSSWLWSRLHYAIRILGLTGLLVGCAGLVDTAVRASLSWPVLREAVELKTTRIGPYLLLAGALAALVALVVELAVVLTVAAGRRSALGLNTLVQIALAVVLLVGVNVYSAGLKLSVLGWDVNVPGHHARLDWTRDRQFTLEHVLSEDMQQQLAGLHAPTRIIVYQVHKTFGSLSAKPDRYDYAAEREVIEKIKDLVDLFREAGPRFEVQVLDVEDDAFEDRLQRLTRDSPKLRQAIDAAQENSIFFQTQRPTGNPLDPKQTEEHVQRLSFNDFYRLDKTASEEGQDGRRNLVLLAQGVGTSGRGVETVARKVLNVEEKKPVVGIAVIHELLTSEGGNPELSLQGLRQALESHGFEVRDIVLREGWDRVRFGMPGAQTVEEVRADSLQASLQDWEDEIAETERELRLLKRAGASPRLIAAGQEWLDGCREVRDYLRGQLAGMDVEGLAERKRLTDLKAKLERFLDECDLLIVPRPTVRDVRGDVIVGWLHGLDAVQAEAIREFARKGKPILACFGPPSVPEGGAPEQGFTAADGVEQMLSRLGFHLGKQTVLFNEDRQSFGSLLNRFLGNRAQVKVPPLQTEWTTGAGRPAGLAPLFPRPPHPIREAVRVAARSVGKGKQLQLQLHYPRPVYYAPPLTQPLPRLAGLAGVAACPAGYGPLAATAFLLVGESVTPEFDPDFLMTVAGAWNEEEPFRRQNSARGFRPPAAGEAEGGTLDARRQGPFPVGVAAEVPIPGEWGTRSAGEPGRVRVAVIGESWFLTGEQLTPAKEILVLNTLNWLLGRDDLLARQGQPWSFPRITLPNQDLWVWAARLGLPVLFAWLGFVVLLTRRLR